jgi:ribose 5-phosphate isomerase A
MQQDNERAVWKRAAGEAAAALIEDGMIVGLGSGSTAVYLVSALARRVKEGLRIVGAVPSSNATAALAAQLGIPLTTLDSCPELDIDIDGADEIDPRLSLIKGGGGALLREKIVASAARRFVVIADATKLVERLGLRMPLPVEIIPFAATPVQKKLERLGAAVQVRHVGDRPYITDNGNMILDCSFPGGLADPVAINDCLEGIIGIVETGLFLHMAERALIGGPDGVRVITPENRGSDDGRH